MKLTNEITLRTDSESEFIAVCEAAGLTTTDDEGNTIVIENAPGAYQMIRLGDLYKPTGETTTDVGGNTIPVFEKLTGYHINVIAKDADFLSEIQIEVDTPLVVWSGY